MTDRDLITAGARRRSSSRGRFWRGSTVYEPDVLASWYKLYGRQDPAGFYELMSA